MTIKKFVLFFYKLFLLKYYNFLSFFSSIIISRHFRKSILINDAPFIYNDDKCLNNYIDELKCGSWGYLYSKSSNKPTLYGTVYALMTKSILGIDIISNKEESISLEEYLNSFQDPSSGLFIDPLIDSKFFRESNWWGSKHLAVHVCAIYTYFNLKPTYRFSFLDEYYSDSFIDEWLNRFDWNSQNIGDTDIDNEIMNVCSLMQFVRDRNLPDANKAKESLIYIKSKLLGYRNIHTLWGGFDISDPAERSRMVQFAYHLLVIFAYDDDLGLFDSNLIIDICLMTQNKVGGFGVKLNSSACEDIDSIDLMIRFASMSDPERRIRIEQSLKKSLTWIYFNKDRYGGYKFKFGEPFIYGHKLVGSGILEGGLMPTWFRTLSLAYIYNFLNINNNFKLKRTPGYEF
jgi:hypothetical protein